MTTGNHGGERQRESATKRVLDTRRIPEAELVVARERVLRELGQVVKRRS